MTLLTGLLIFGGTSSCTKQNGYISRFLSNVEEPQTDDERTLVGEYNDYLAYADSLAAAWDGTDTLSMRRLYYNLREQESRINKVKKYKNIRRSLVDAIESNIDVVYSKIYEKFSPDLCNELYSFHEYFDLNGIIRTVNPKDVVDGTIYTNSYGEHYCLVNAVVYKHINKDAFPEAIECVLKYPIKEKDINSFKENLKRYKAPKVIYKPEVEMIEAEEAEIIELE